MKLPKYVLLNVQDCLKAQLNGFGLQLVAESFADEPEKYGDANIVACVHSHQGTPVWFVISKTQPRPEDFEP